MQMHIEIPSGKVFLNGHVVHRLKRMPYIVVDGVRSPLSEEEKKLAREMQKVFAPLTEMEESK